MQKRLENASVFALFSQNIAFCVLTKLGTQIRILIPLCISHSAGVIILSEAKLSADHSQQSYVLGLLQGACAIYPTS